MGRSRNVTDHRLRCLKCLFVYVLLYTQNLLSQVHDEKYMKSALDVTQLRLVLVLDICRCKYGRAEEGQKLLIQEAPVARSGCLYLSVRICFIFCEYGPFPRYVLNTSPWIGRAQDSGVPTEHQELPFFESSQLENQIARNKTLGLATILLN